MPAAERLVRSGASQSFGDHRIADDHHARPRKHRREQRTGFREDPGTDVDRVAALAERDGLRTHRLTSAPRRAAPRRAARANRAISSRSDSMTHSATSRYRAIARRVELDQPGGGIGRIEQRAMPALARALAQHLGQRVQVERRCRWPSTARGWRPGSRHRRRSRARCSRIAAISTSVACSAVTEGRLALDLEDRRNRTRRACARARRRRRRRSCRAGAPVGGRAWTCPRRAVRPETDCPDANAPGHCSGIGSAGRAGGGASAVTSRR